MNKQNRPHYFMAAAALAALLLPAGSVRAENGFRVSNETGLELNAPAPGLNVPAPKPADVKKAKAPPVAEERKTTEITCTGETTFDAKSGMAVFVKDVKVTDPQFALTSDKLTVYLKKTEKEPAKGTPGATPAATPAPSATPKPDAKAEAKPDAASGLERAVAEGHAVITQDKVDEKTGEVTHYIGRAAKADYNAVNGEMTLTGWPQIQQGLNNQVASEEGTVMILDRDGHMHTKGPSMTVIKSETKPETKPAKTP
ncbi:MAG: LptA/OstA family protein [Verrucomicrobiota bacterium]